MKSFYVFFILLAGSAISAASEDCDHYTVQPYEGGTTKDPAAMKQLTAYWAKNTCFKKSDNSEPNMKEQCKDVCFPSSGNSKDQAIASSQTCDFGSSPWIDARTGNTLLCGKDKNFPGVMMKTGYCKCDSPILEFAGNFFIQGVIEAGKILEKVICPALQALDIVMAIGMDAIPPPGRAVTGGMLAAARSAKAYKYAYEAQDAAQEWANFFLGGLDFAGQAGCPPLIKPSKQDLMAKAFGPLSNTPDDAIPGGMNYDSLPCPAKGCRGCKGPNCRNDDKHDDAHPSKSNVPAAPTTRRVQTVAATSTILSKAASSSPSMTSSHKITAATSSSVISSVTAVSTLGCKGMAAVYASEDAPESEFRRRSYPIDLASPYLSKRAAEKNAKACGITIKSFKYPSSGEWRLNENPKRYGFNVWNACDNYDWGNADTGSGVRYESEHVLEWQIVGGFFTKMGEDITTEFDHPDPQKNTKIKFCEYWKESWSFHSGQLIDNPLQAPQVLPSSALSTAPALGTPLSTMMLVFSHSSGAVPVSSVSSIAGPGPSPSPMAAPNSKSQRTPLNWLASQYPYRDPQNGGGEAWLDEMPLLERRMNGQNKEPLFSQKPVADGKPKAIRSEDLMQKLVEGKAKLKVPTSQFDQGIEVVKYLREMIGTIRYMQENEIEKIFVKQKKRLGAMIEAIDKNLHKTPRKVERRKDGSVRIYAPWQEQGLGKRWNDYMDDVFKGAKQRATDYMNLHLGNLEKEWNSKKKREEYEPDKHDDDAARSNKKDLEKIQKDMLALIDKTRKEWDKVKDWKKPDGW